jgi:RimJ/RimL family protein N-acetyltransferase
VLTPFVLEDRHVRLEPLVLEHVPGLADAAAEDRTSYAFTRVPDGLEDTEAYVRSALLDQATGTSLPFAVRRLSDDRLVGSTRFLDLERFGGPVPDDEHPPTVAEIGSTWYAASAQRTAVNSACKLLLLSRAFDDWGCLRVTLKTDARNRASRAGIERLGALFEGGRRAHTTASDGTVRDSAYYSILAAEWPAVRDRLVR